MKEVWKDIYYTDEVTEEIIDFRGYYQISNLGRVKSLARVHFRKNGVKLSIREKVISPGDNGHGYLFVTLYNGESKKRFYVHRLVGQMFLQKEEGKIYIDHIDTNRTNNCVENLRWCTQKENANNSLTLKRNSDSKDKTRVIAINEKDCKVIMLKSISDGKKIGFDKAAIWRCCNGKQKEHLGYKFQYVEKRGMIA